MRMNGLLLRICSDGRKIDCDMEPPPELFASWQACKDNQIMGLEILSIALGGLCDLCHTYVRFITLVIPGFSTFAEELCGRDVVIWSDNTGAEHAVDKGGIVEHTQTMF